MGLITSLHNWEEVPNTAIKTVGLLFPNTTDENDTYDLTLADYGISATGLLTIKSWVHTTSGSIIVTDIATCSVTTGTLTITLQSANANSTRYVEIQGTAAAGDFS